MSEDLIPYPVLIDQAMRHVVRDVLKRVHGSGLPGEHHFFISFLTGYPGVRISEQLKNRYPHEITIVLQHQFWDFKVEEGYFQVTLSFGGIPEKLIIPYAAMTAFADPSIKFGLQFQPSDIPEIAAPDVAPAAPESKSVAAASADDGSAEIISLDSFRKK